jgi:threonine dehydratase
VERTRSYGAEVILAGENYDAAFDHAERLKEERGRVYVHAYDDERIVAGQGTIGLEILEQVPDVETIVVPVGGGGLISGIALAVKSLAPRCRVVGVEPSVIPSMKRALEVGGPVTLDAHRTLADGIAVRRVGELNYALCRSYVDEIVTVDDNAIAGAVLYLLENEKVVAEGAGAAPVAALLGGQIKGGRGTVVAVVSGGNIDVNLIERIIERGLVESGRLARVGLSVPDRPGALADVLERIAEQGANVLKVHHERTFTPASLSLVTVEVVVETRGTEHVNELLRALENAGYKVEQ